MSLLHNNPTLLQALIRLSISLFYGLFFLPPILFAFIFISFAFFLILPTLFVFASAFLFLNTACHFSIELLGMILVRFCSWQYSSGKDMSNGSISAVKMVEGVEEKQVSVELDPSEFPSLYESEDEEKEKEKEKEEEKEEAGNHGSCTPLDSRWEIRVPKYVDRKEHNRTFYELLTYWRSKERGGIQKC